MQGSTVPITLRYVKLPYTCGKPLNLPTFLQVGVNHTADWWLGNLDDPWFKALEGAVHETWGEEPLRIREGGVSDPSDSIATIPR
jgi:hypothetical protein